MAQLVARLHGMEEVWGSNPHSSTRWAFVVADLRSASPKAVVFPGGDPRTPEARALPSRGFIFNFNEDS